MSSKKKTETARAREERLAAARKEQRAAERKRSLLLYGAAAMAVLLIAGAIVWAITKDPVRQAGADGIDGVTTVEYPAGKHTTAQVDYAESPPVGGEHNPVWLNCGVYDTPVPDENAVHSLEHGAVWVTYRPDLPKADVATLEKILPDTYTLLSPYEGLDSPIAISAWGSQLKVDSADDPRLAAFVKEYRQGPQTPEPGAACTGGVGA